MSVIKAGLDEAGRGCLAGPVYAAAVILPARFRLRGLDDSKKMSRAAREELAPQIQAGALAWAVALATVEEIEEHNILQASLLAMQRAAEALAVLPALALVDGNRAPALKVPVQTVVDGDAKIPAIMAASILAKVARDAEMLRLDTQYPGYGFARHKGYGTREHLAALRAHGPCAVHRRGFAPVRQLQLALGAPA